MYYHRCPFLSLCLSPSSSVSVSSFSPPSLSPEHTLTMATFSLPLSYSLCLCTDLAQGWSGCHRGGCHLRRRSASPVPPLGPRCPPPALPPAALGTQQHRVTSWTSPQSRQGRKLTFVIIILSQKWLSRPKFSTGLLFYQTARLLGMKEPWSDAYNG